MVCFHVQVTSWFIFWLNFLKEIREDFFRTRFQTNNTKILNGLSAVKAFGVQYSNPNWARQELISDLYVSQVSALTVGNGSRAQHAYLFSDMHWGLFCLFFFFFKGYKGNLSMWIYKIFLILNISKKCMQNSLVLGTISLL